jgi:serine phosphatase RsbU (regulator of sigma subunit)
MIKDEPNFEVICFALPDKKSFFRAHAPKKYGDDISNVGGIKEVSTTHTKISGFMISKLGLYYRLTVPVFKENRFIGIIAFGINLGYVNDFIQKELQTDSAILVETSKFKDTKLFNKLEEGSLGKYTIISSTGDIIEEASERGIDLEDKDFKFNYDKKIFNIISDINIEGLYEKNIAKVILFQDITKESKIYERYLYVFIFTLILLIAILSTILILSFNKFLSTVLIVNNDLEDLNENLEKKVITRTNNLNEAKKELEKINKQIKDSINYAAIIQSSLLPDNITFEEFFTDSFTFWRPKDIVGGDIYLFEKVREDESILMFIDCTGHGIPGAFVTMLVKAVERQIISEIKSNPDMEISPAWMMGYFNKSIKKLLNQESKDSLSNAGWDGGIIYYNKKTDTIKFAGAETTLFYLDTDENIQKVKGNRYSVGYKTCSKDYEYKEETIKVEKGMKFYCTTDGYLDQNGGEKDFPFGKKRFSNIIKEYNSYSMADQKEIFLMELESYKQALKNNEQNDDITLIGFTI